jgi:hypothetical protein
MSGVTAFGLDIRWGLPDDCQPLEVIGTVKYLDAEGRPEYWVFESFGLGNVEATGMTELQRHACRDEMATNLMLSMSVIGEEDDDEEEDDDDAGD